MLTPSPHLVAMRHIPIIYLYQIHLLTYVSLVAGLPQGPFLGRSLLKPYNFNEDSADDECIQTTITFNKLLI